MKTENPQQPFKLEIDAEQWQRDIRTFAETTNQALVAIVSQLSNSCSTQPSIHRQAPNAQISWDQFEESTKRPERALSLPSESSLPSPLAATENSDCDRLSRLKSQLARRISR